MGLRTRRSTPVGLRLTTLQHDDACSVCRDSTPAGARAWYDSTTKQVTCRACLFPSPTGPGKTQPSPQASDRDSGDEPEDTDLLGRLTQGRFRGVPV